MRVDAHVHIWDVRRGGVPTPYALPTRHASAEALLVRMASERVDRAVLVQPQAHGSDHRLLLDAVERHPDQFVGVGLIDCDGSEPADIAAEVHRLADAGLVGVRVHLIGGGGRHACVAASAAARAGLALELHVDEPSWTRVRSLAEAAGDALVMVDHLGRPDDPASGSAHTLLRALVRQDNVIVKVAALEVVSRRPPPHEDLLPLLADALDALGADRLMWGSNFPWCCGVSYGAGLRALDRLKLTAREREALLGGTAERLLFAGGDRTVV